jgi:transitional endoplasmic reticulum ATPase
MQQMQHAAPPLLPVQQAALARLEQTLAAHHVAVLIGRHGVGKSTVLRALHARMGGTYATTREFIEASVDRHPLALDETVYTVLKGMLSADGVVIVDDFQLIAAVSCCTPAYPRMNFLAAALHPLAEFARREGKTLVYATNGLPVPGVELHAQRIAIAPFTVEDYRALCARYLGAERAATLDIAKVFRFAPKLDGHQLRDTCESLRSEAVVDTDRFIDYLREHHLASNVDLGEVQAVDLRDLKGLDDVLEALEANVILPLENAELAEELDLKPKRGVLLAGPPGTGKTTIGRALAHRLKSKFFLLDGTVISGSHDFFARVQHIFEEAKRNAPGIIFIDDSDVLFENSQDTGFYRYLLTMLDGLESASAGRICLMMTAMDVGSLPPALVRSGRVELWLQTSLPSQDARAAILADRCAQLSRTIGSVDVDALAAASEGLSGADLKRVIDDGKLLYAYDRARGMTPDPATGYFLRAIETVRRNKEQYAAAELRARTRQPMRGAHVPGFAYGFEHAMSAEHGWSSFPPFAAASESIVVGLSDDSEP